MIIIKCNTFPPGSNFTSKIADNLRKRLNEKSVEARKGVCIIQFIDLSVFFFLCFPHYF